MNSKTLFRELTKKIKLPESDDEIRQLAFMVMEHEFGLSHTEVLMERTLTLDPDIHMRLDYIVDRLNRHEPIQYILGEAHFFGRKFIVDSSVLIPRPETEELIRLIPSPPATSYEKSGPIRILDIGTGSGCIAITLKLVLPLAEVFAADISEAALKVARKNAEKHNASVEFLTQNILKEEIPVKELDLIVSNPPYIAKHEKAKIKPNVTDYEPHLALFVEGDDPLLFYRAIASKGKMALKPGGKILVEINEAFGTGVAEIFSNEGYTDVSILKDIHMKDRIVSATWIPS
jgi:release factor glutamine methyltransferase